MTREDPKWHVSYQRHVEYEIVCCPDLFNPDNDALLSVGNRENTRRFVVADVNINRIYSAGIRDYFGSRGVDARVLTFPGGEDFKSVDGYLSILNELDSFPINRRDEPIIAIGGGVLTDVVGFVAGTYRRGVPHIKVPTTLMGMIDAALGIKTGINFNGNKNRLGSFEPPRKVFLDRAFLKTLPRRHILNGVCEILKLALIKDGSLFELLESYGARCVDSNFQDDKSASILDRSIQGMLDELQPNLFEDDLARRMDFGHTFCYGLETSHNSQLLHGEAVLMDVILSAILSRNRSLLSERDLNRILDLVSKLGIPLNFDLVDPDLLWKSIQERTCHRNGFQRVPLPAGVGDCVFVNDVKWDELESACSGMLERCAG